MALQRIGRSFKTLEELIFQKRNDLKRKTGTGFKEGGLIFRG